MKYFSTALLVFFALAACDNAAAAADVNNVAFSQGITRQTRQHSPYPQQQEKQLRGGHRQQEQEQQQQNRQLATSFEYQQQQPQHQHQPEQMHHHQEEQQQHHHHHFEGFFNLGCRTRNGGKGKPHGHDYMEYQGYSLEWCQKKCSNDATCKGYEYGGSSGCSCQIWFHWYDIYQEVTDGSICAKKLHRLVQH